MSAGDEAEAASGSLGEVYVDLRRRYERIVARLEAGAPAGPASSSGAEEEDVETFLTHLRAVEARVARGADAVFSSNESVQDVATENLGFLLLPFYAGHLLGLERRMEHRAEALASAENELRAFLTRVENMDLLEGDEEAEWMMDGSAGEDPAQRRLAKIARFKAGQAAKTRLEEIQALRDGGRTGVDEEVLREAALLEVKLSVHQALEELQQIKDERPMLEMMMAAQSGRGGPPGPGVRAPPPREPADSGIKVTRLNKAEDGSLVMQREVVRSKVFGSSVIPPSMTVEEFGELELQRAQEREAASAAMPKPDMKTAELEAEGKEDDAVLADKATMRDREWDNWKDENPRGIGNKMER